MGNWFASQCCGTRQVYIDQDVESSFIVHCTSSCCNRKKRIQNREDSFFSKTNHLEYAVSN